MAQLDLFTAKQPGSRSATPDPQEVRRRLDAMLETLRAAHILPWTEDELRFHRTVVPQMTNWLDDDEALQVRNAFEGELQRLNAA